MTRSVTLKDIIGPYRENWTDPNNWNTSLGGIRTTDEDFSEINFVDLGGHLLLMRIMVH